MIWPLIPARLHGWLDDLVVAIYLAGAYYWRGFGLILAFTLFGAAVHFTLARITDYPQGQWKLISFRTHAFIELSEGIVLALGGIWLFCTGRTGSLFPWWAVFLMFMGLSQFIAFSFSDYRWPLPDCPPAAATK